MKKMMKFAAMLAAALAFVVSCDQKEDNEPLTIEGKQWVCLFDDLDLGQIPGVVDLGYTTPGKINFGIQTEENGPWVETGYLELNMDYTVEALTETSGIVSYTYVWNDVTYTEKFLYSDLTETSVKFGEWTEDPMETSMFWFVYDEPATVASSPITIELLSAAE